MPPIDQMTHAGNRPGPIAIAEPFDVMDSVVFDRKDDMVEVRYRCADPDCRHEQIIRFFPSEQPYPCTCCVKCRAGFGIELGEQLRRMKGMFPIID